MKKGILVVLIIIVMTGGVSFADSIDMSQMDAIFKEFDEFSSTEKSKYYEMIEGAMDSDESLEGLAKNLSFLLSESQMEKLEKKGYSISEVRSNIRKLKTWSRDDRMTLVDAFRSKNREKLNDLNRVNAKGSLQASSGLIEESMIVFTEAQTIAFQHGLRYLAIQTLAEIPEFDDLDDHWSKNEVIELASIGIINGKRKGAFYPDDYISRIEILAILTRISVYDDSKLAEGEIQCDESLWYYKPLKRATRLGMIDSDLEDHLMVLATREEVVADMMKAYAAFEFESSEPLHLQTFKDENQIKPKNREAFRQAVALGFVQGWHGELKPTDPITRAEAAVMANRFYKKIIAMQGIGE
ncbi:hypothetical protein SANA_27520 [Gottschalkiaceae bacterium SANA]|nr:hypothetical protein SANA_27520 [Gottschalkiaceae bacterium SANA]